MRFPTGVTDQYIYFVAVDSTDLKTRETGLSSFTVYRARNGAAAAAYTTPTIAEVSSSNMPGVYSLLLDEDMTIDSGDHSQEVVLHITQAAMAPVTLKYELYRPDVTAGTTALVDANGRVDVIKIAGTTQTARDIGASVLISSGTGTGQLSVTSGVIAANVTQFGGTNGTFSAGRPEVNTTHAAGTAWGSGAITAASIATGAFTSAKAAAGFFDAVWTVTVRTLTANTNLNDLSAAGIRTAVGLASANLDTQLTTIDDFLDTEVAAIKAKTDNLPSDPADASDIAAAFGTVNSTLATIAGYIDTEIGTLTTMVDAIPTNAELATALGTADDAVLAQVALVKAKTDLLTFTVSGQVDANIQYVNDVQVTGNGQPGTEWGP